MIRKIKSIAFGLCLAGLAYGQQQPNESKSPHLEKRGNATQLIVNGKPFIILGGELYNSSSSNLNYLAPLWEPLKKNHLNTALVAVSWQLVEPAEGQFDFSLVDGIIKGAREHDLHIVLLWFGSWKNGLSHYVPTWVKQNPKRFPRIVLNNGRSTETISALSAEANQADAKAFAALMKHVKEIDAQTATVLMVQVENEVGIIGSPRDYSPLANAAFEKPVPEKLMTGLSAHKADLQPQLKNLWQNAGAKTSGTWREVFGQGNAAEEAFMAWQYGNYINTVAKAGKDVYDIPMFVNTWIVQPEDKAPGDYPSGGPQVHVHDIWRIAAPAIDIKAPDIYLPDFREITTMYHHTWNPLFIPESFTGEDGAANAFYLVGEQNGIGYSPFGIDRKTVVPEQAPLAKAYNVLSQLTPEITAAQSGGNIKGFILSKKDSVQHFELGGYQVTVTLKTDWKGNTLAAKGYGLIIYSGTDEFTVAGADVNVSFIPLTTGPKTAGLASVREGIYENGIWIPGRELNGDEIMISYELAKQALANRTGTGLKFNAEPSIMKVKLYRF